MEMERPLPVMKAFKANPPTLYIRPFPQQNTLINDPSSLSSSYLRPEPPKTTTSPNGINVSNSIVDDSDQISVFDAENYFNERNAASEQNDKRIRVSSSSGGGVQNHHVINQIDHGDSAAEYQRHEFSKVSRPSSVSSSVNNGYAYGGRNYHTTPTASSEASWNSQVGLLSNPPGSSSIALSFSKNNRKQLAESSSSSTSTNTNNVAAAATTWILGRNCACFCRKSVQVLKEKDSDSPKRQSPRARTVDLSVPENQYTRNAQKSSIMPQEDVVERPADQKVIPNLQRISSKNRFPSNITRPPLLHHHHRQKQQVGMGLPYNDIGIGFSFPILLNQSSSRVILKYKPNSCNPLEDPPRGSLEVFQPPDCNRQSSSRTSFTGSDRDGRNFMIPASPMSRITTTDEDAASDASSDLFEIESFSTQPSSSSYHLMYRRLDEAAAARSLAANGGGTALYGSRRSLEEPVMPSIADTATEYCYEPSEASIDWSVTTAEGFDRGSVTNFSISASDFGDFPIVRTHDEKVVIDGDGGGKMRASGNGGLLMLSCQNEKAVSVGGPAGGGDRIGTVTSGGGGGSDGRPPHRVVVSNNKPPLGRSRSGRLPLGFAT